MTQVEKAPCGLEDWSNEAGVPPRGVAKGKGKEGEVGDGLICSCLLATQRRMAFTQHGERVPEGSLGRAAQSKLC